MKRKRDLRKRTSQVRRQRDPIPWRYCILTTVCGLLLLGGFFAAAKQHFSTVGYAMDNAKLRVRIAKLKDEKRKLRLSKERASSPVRIASLANKIGFTAVPRKMVAKPRIPERVDVIDEAPRYTHISAPASGDRISEPVQRKMEIEHKTRLSGTATLVDSSKDQIAQIVSLVKSKSITGKN